MSVANCLEENVRDIPNEANIPMTMGHYLRSMQQLADQWSTTNFRDVRRQRLYMKDIDCPTEWHDSLQKIIHPCLFYLNENVTSSGAKEIEEGDVFRSEMTAAPAGDLMSSLPDEMRAQNLMCYIGHEGTYTPAHREMCASLGQNIMVEASGSENGDKPGSSVWFMTESKDRQVVREYFLSMLGHDIEIEKHFAQINAWKKAPFEVYVVEQKAGDFIIIPPLAAHQVWNRGTRTMKVAWNRTTADTLEMAIHEALPKARLVCRDEQYKNKALVYYTLDKYYRQLKVMEESESKSDMNFMDLSRTVLRDSQHVKQLIADFKKLFGLYTEILVNEYFATKEKEVEMIPFDSCITCSYCRSNIFNRFLTCKNCVRHFVTGEEDTYDVCMECYAMGRSCACLSGLQWCEQWEWSELIDKYELWRTMVIANDGFVDLNTSPSPLEVARQKSAKKSLAQICQEALRRRPWTDITKHPLERFESESEDDAAKKSNKKKSTRKKKKGDVRTCHVCCHKDYAYRVQVCSNPGCEQGYCYGVLYRAFDMLPQDVLEDEDWQCPKCRGFCNCGGCRRTGNTNAYMPKNTSLGHDTRKVADDRSVEALVDFRLHNLAWLKATGEESRSQTSKRMQRLREQADNAKAQGLPEQAEADRQIQQSAEMANNGADPDADLPTYDELAAQPTAPDESATDAFPADFDASQAAPPVEEESLFVDDSDYPDPSVFGLQQRIGMGYYEQGDTEDAILFDPYQEPTADAIRLDKSEVSENVKKAIRAARKKQKRENEDPEFVVGRSNKRRRAEPQTDVLDSMDPALFSVFPVDEEPAAEDESTQANAEDIAEGAEAAEQPATTTTPKKRTAQHYEANEPVLRHAQPKASYVEAEEIDIEEEVARVAPTRPRSSSIVEIREADSEENAEVILQQPADNEGEAEEVEHEEEPAPEPVKKRRGRPPKMPRMSIELPFPPAESSDDEEPAAAEADDDSDAEHEQMLLDLETQLAHDIKNHKPAEEEQPAKRKPGRPRKSGVTTIAAATSQIQDESSDAEDPQPVKSGRCRGRSRGRPRGRPRGTGVTRSSPPRPPPTVALETPQFMSMAERMAARGKKFKIGVRKSRSSAAPKQDPTREETVTVTSRRKSGSATETEWPGVQPSRSFSISIGRKSDDAKTNAPEVRAVSGSDNDSSDNDDIPATLPGNKAPAPMMARRSRGARGPRGLGRGRPRGRPRTRP